MEKWYIFWVYFVCFSVCMQVVDTLWWNAPVYAIQWADSEADFGHPITGWCYSIATKISVICQDRGALQRVESAPEPSGRAAKAQLFNTPVWAQEHCKFSAHVVSWLSVIRGDWKRKQSTGSFVLLYFGWFAFWVVFSVCFPVLFCLSLSVK